ncbi:peptidyl-prolyl cis-trans isomerase [Nitratireductor rhodophyticola]|uniref:peptidyl-prolyl cis-trans isomerase n=1 Tax=Nitratireductor rhodophyticola TaxID=2854036 RepID=UPI0030084D4E
MAQGWRQSWSDLLDSLRGGPPRAREDRPLAPPPSQREEPTPDQPVNEGDTSTPGTTEQESSAAGFSTGLAETVGTTAVTAQQTVDGDDSADTPVRAEVTTPQPEPDSGEPRKLSGRSYTVIAVIAALAVVSWLLSPYDFGTDLWPPEPPAPDVVATFDGGRITLTDVESHLNVLVPSRLRELARSQEALLAVVEDLISDQLIRRWAAERKPEGEEAFRHAVKHINEELSLDSFASQLHEESLPIAESEMRKYYETNEVRFEGQTFAQAREDIRQILVAEREPEFIESYLERLRTNASIARSFELLDVPPPSEEELESYYEANLNEFALPRRAVVDEIEIPVAAFGDAAQQRAGNVLLRIRGGASFKEAATRLPETRLSVGREVAEGTRLPDWDRNVFALVPGELGSVFRAGESFYIVRLSELKPARTQSLSEVRRVVAAAVERQKEQDWFEANGEKTLFTLKGQRYSLKQFYKEYQELPASAQRQYAGPDGLRKLANALIDRMLLVADTYDNLLDVKTKPLADETRLRLLRQMMEQEEVDDKIEVTEAEMKEFYKANVEQMVYPPRARIRYIRIGLGASDDEMRRARKRADEAYRKLVPGLFGDGADFAVVAQEYSEDPESAAKGGELAGWVGEGSDPLTELMDHPFHEAVLRLEPGEVSKPFEIAGSLYIVQVMERTKPQLLSLKEARPFIEEVLTERKHRALAADLQERQLKQANVKLYPEVLETYFENLAQPSGKNGSNG